LDDPKDLQCGICCGVYFDPVQPCEYGHIFCRDCIEELRLLKKNENEERVECPWCRKVLSKNYDAIFVKSIVSKLKVKCRFNESKACEWTGEAHELLHHLEQDCQFLEVDCPLYNPFENSCVESCNGKILNCNYNDHLRTAPFDSVCLLIKKLTNKKLNSKCEEIKAVAPPVKYTFASSYINNNTNNNNNSSFNNNSLLNNTNNNNNSSDPFLDGLPTFNPNNKKNYIDNKRTFSGVPIRTFSGVPHNPIINNTLYGSNYQSSFLSQHILNNNFLMNKNGAIDEEG
jgi:hypothetical protein